MSPKVIEFKTNFQKELDAFVQDCNDGKIQDCIICYYKDDLPCYRIMTDSHYSVFGWLMWNAMLALSGEEANFDEDGVDNR